MKGKASSSSTGAGTSIATTHETPSAPIGGSRVTRQTLSRLSLSEMSSSTFSGPVQPEKQSPVAGKMRRRQSLDATSDGHLPVPRKRRKTGINTSAELHGTPPISSSTRSRSLQSTPPLTTKATLNGVYQTPAAKISPGLLADEAKGLMPPVRTPSIRRIKLIVRAPEPVYTHPKQKPNPPIFNKMPTKRPWKEQHVSVQHSLNMCTPFVNKVGCSYLPKTPVVPSKPGQRILGRSVPTHGTTYSMRCAHATASEKRAADPKSQLPSPPKCARTGNCRMRKKAG